MLWLDEAVKAFRYAELLRNGETRDQASLSKPLIIVNIREFDVNTSHLAWVLTETFRSLAIWEEQSAVNPTPHINGPNRR